MQITEELAGLEKALGWKPGGDGFWWIPEETVPKRLRNALDECRNIEGYDSNAEDQDGHCVGAGWWVADGWELKDILIIHEMVRDKVRELWQTEDRWIRVADCLYETCIDLMEFEEIQQFFHSAGPADCDRPATEEERSVAWAAALVWLDKERRG